MLSPRHVFRVVSMCAIMFGVAAHASEEPSGRHPEPMAPRLVSHRPNLDTFSAYQGEKSPVILVALIGREVSPIIRQEPAVALSDGKKTLKIMAYLGLGDGNSPNFALNGADLISLSRSPAPSTDWIIEALPRAGSTRASLTILTNNEMIDYPLTLAPPVAGISGLDADFSAFLKDSGAWPPKHDLNGDGRHDYLDDFIYTANYLAARAHKNEKKK